MKKFDDLLLIKFKKDGTLEFYDNFLATYPAYHSKYNSPSLSAFVSFIKEELKLFRKSHYPGVIEFGYDDALCRFINLRHPTEHENKKLLIADQFNKEVL